MALPASLQNAYTPEELEWVAEQEETVEVVLSHRLDKTRFISQWLGPLVAGRKTRIPLWLATTLKKQRRCRIVAPDWMAHLEELLKAETTQESFSELPERHLEVSRLLLEAASDDIPDVERVRSLLKDLREVRQAKARQGIVAMEPVELTVTNMGSMELNEIRPFLTLAWRRMIALDPDEQTRIDAGYVKDVREEADEEAENRDADFTGRRDDSAAAFVDASSVFGDAPMEE